MQTPTRARGRAHTCIRGDGNVESLFPGDLYDVKHEFVSETLTLVCRRDTELLQI